MAEVPVLLVNCHTSVEYNRELIETVKIIHKDLKELSKRNEETFRSLDLLAIELEVFHADFYVNPSAVQAL